MNWNYRVIRHHNSHTGGTGDVWFAVHEVYYDESDNPVSITERPVAPQGQTLEEVLKDMELMRAAADKPTLDYMLFSDMERGNNGGE